MWKTRSRPPAASSGRAKSTSRTAATSARAGSTSTSVTETPGMRVEQPGHAAAHGPGPDDGHPVTDQWRGVPQCVHRCLDDSGEHRALDRHVVGHDRHCRGRHDVRRLVWVEAEDGAPAQVWRAVLDQAHVEVAVLDRAGEVAVLEGRAHHVVLARRHVPAEDEALRPPADSRAKRPDGHVLVSRSCERGPTDLADARLPQPERQCLSLRPLGDSVCIRPPQLPRSEPEDPPPRSKT